MKRSKLTELVKSLQQPLPMVSFSSLHGNVLRSSILVTFTPYCCCREGLVEVEVARVYWKSGGVGGTGDGEGGWIDEKGVIGDVQP